MLSFVWYSFSQKSDAGVADVVDAAMLLTLAAVITWGEAAAEPTGGCTAVVEDADAEALAARMTGALEVRCAPTAKEDSVPQ